ncbi:MAG: hypothetical protein E6G03_14135 [Actinobacteria bacterium]|nr:MAG: hypothetical protein E6G03_14135 [Actinomycetota bacterium]
MQNESDSASILRNVLADEQGYTGEGDDLKAALNDAYEKGKAAGHRVFRVKDIYIRGDNPLSGYAVVIIPHG